jgi:hypothetical protein
MKTTLLFILLFAGTVCFAQTTPPGQRIPPPIAPTFPQPVDTTMQRRGDEMERKSQFPQDTARPKPVPRDTDTLRKYMRRDSLHIIDDRDPKNYPDTIP